MNWRKWFFETHRLDRGLLARQPWACSGTNALLPAEYLDAIIDDDVYRIERRQAGLVPRCAYCCAHWPGTRAPTATNRTLMKDVRAWEDEDLDAGTIAAYLDIFRRLFRHGQSTAVSAGARPSASNSRRSDSPSVLACALLKTVARRPAGDLETLGFLFEAL